MSTPQIVILQQRVRELEGKLTHERACHADTILRAERAEIARDKEREARSNAEAARDSLHSFAAAMETMRDDQRQRAERAEAEASRLREALRECVEALEAARDQAQIPPIAKLITAALSRAREMSKEGK